MTEGILFDMMISTTNSQDWQSVQNFYRQNGLYIEVKACGEKGIEFINTIKYDREDFEKRLKEIITDYMSDVEESYSGYNDESNDYFEFEVFEYDEGTIISEYENVLLIELADESILEGMPEVQKVIKILTTKGKAALEWNLWENEN